MSICPRSYLLIGVSDVASEVQDGHVLGVVGDSQLLLSLQGRAQRYVGEHEHEPFALKKGAAIDENNNNNKTTTQTLVEGDAKQESEIRRVV